MDAIKIRKAAEEKLAQARALLEPYQGRETEVPADVLTKANALYGEFDQLKAALKLAQDMGEADKYMKEPLPTKAAHLGFREAGPEEGNVPVDAKAWRVIEVKTVLGEKKEVRYNVPLAVQARDYASAFEAYLRKGYAALGPEDRKTLTEGVDTAGGFLVPEDLQTQIIKKVAQTAVMRGLCQVRQTSRDIATWPRVNYSSDDIYTSGVRLTWTGESPASSTVHRVTDPITGQVKIPVHTAMASLPISNDLIEDAAFDVIGVASDLISEAYALGEDNAFINGNGVGQPMGLLAEVNTANGPAEVHIGTSPTLAGLLNLEAALPSQYERNARFMARKTFWNTLRSVAATTSGDLIWPVTAQYGYLPDTPPTLMGYPIVKCEFVPAIATDAYSLIFGDFSGYCILDRVGLAIRRLDDVYAESNVTVLLARKRVGGYCVEPYRFKIGQMSA